MGGLIFWAKQKAIVGRSADSMLGLALSFSPTLHELRFYSLTIGFTNLIMRIRFVCHGLISLHVNLTLRTET